MRKLLIELNVSIGKTYKEKTPGADEACQNACTFTLSFEVTFQALRSYGLLHKNSSSALLIIVVIVIC